MPMVEQSLTASQSIPKVDRVRQLFPTLLGYFIATAVGAVWKDFGLPFRIPVVIGILSLVSAYATSVLDGRAAKYPVRAVLFAVAIGVAAFLWMVVWM